MTNQELVKNDPNYVCLHDHGFVGLIQVMGTDADITQAARVSYGAGTKSVNDDRNLIRYLLRHRHTSPLEMAEVKFHIKLPIFVMRQLVRHRTANLNEYSGRYSEMSDEFYTPTAEYMAPQSTTNKQGRAGTLSVKAKGKIKSLIESVYKAAYETYKTLLGDNKVGLADEEDEYPGLSRELSRLILPVSNYTECYFKMDLHNFFHMARLRRDSHAQKEIQDYANAMFDLVKPHFPLAAEAFEDYSMQALLLSRMDINALKDIIAGRFVNDAVHYDMSKREFQEFSEQWVPKS